MKERNPYDEDCCTSCKVPFKDDKEVYPGEGRYDALCEECWLKAIEAFPDLPLPEWID